MTNVIGPLPYNIVNGSPVDAGPVMGNFNWIVNQVNTNSLQPSTLAAANGASLVGYQLNSVGANATTVLAKLQGGMVDSNDFCASLVNTTNDATTALQAFFTAITTNSSPVHGGAIGFLRAGTYYVGSASLFLRSNTSIYCEPGVVFQPISGGLVNGSGYGFEMFGIVSGSSNISIIGNGATFVGNRDATQTGEGGSIFLIDGPTNLYFENINANNGGGDGFSIIGGSSPTKNSAFVNCNATGNGRNNWSIINADGLSLWNCGGFNATKPSGGASPSGPYVGFDLEPDTGSPANYALRNVLLYGCKSSGNAQGGVLIVPAGLDATSKNMNVLIHGFTSVNDGSAVGGSAPGAIRITQLNLPTNASSVNGQIKFVNCSVEGSYNNAYEIDNCYYSPNTRVIFDSCIATNVSTNGTSTNANSEGFYFASVFGASSGVHGGIDLINCRVIDNRASPLTVSGLYIAGLSGLSWNHVEVRDCYQSGAVGGGVGAFCLARGFATPTISYTNPPQYTASGNLNATNMQDLFGFEVICGTTSLSFTLPPYTQWGNNKVSVTNSPGSYCTVFPDSSDTFQYGGFIAGGGMSIHGADSSADFVCVGTNAILPRNVTGECAPVATNVVISGRIFWGSAPPSTGTYFARDIMYNSAPTVGQPVGWSCTASGTPGTWHAWANL